jgi:hypothetical protein
MITEEAYAYLSKLLLMQRNLWNRERGN